MTRVEIPRELLDHLDYDPLTGEFYWTQNRINRGYRADRLNKTSGYRQISFNNKSYQAHRVAWFIHHQTQPTSLDHINRIKSDNRISNLREVSLSLNTHNVEDKRYTSSSGYRGVFKHKNKWRAVISIEGSRKHLGLYPTPEEASAVYEEYRPRV